MVPVLVHKYQVFVDDRASSTGKGRKTMVKVSVVIADAMEKKGT